MRSFVCRLSCVAVVLGLALPGRAIEPKYLPPNADVAVTINLKQILESELLKDKKDLVEQAKSAIKAKLDESPAKKYLDQAGFDIFKDLHTITVTSDGSKDPDALFIAIEGKFDPEKLVSVAKEASAQNGDVLKVSKVGNTNVFEITPKDNEKTIYAALIGDNLMVAAPSREKLNASIARASGGKTSGINAGLKKVLDTTNNKQSFSFVASAAGMAKMAANAPKQPGGDVGAMLQNLEGMAMSLTVSKDIVLQVAATASDDDNAKKMAVAANLGIGGLKAMVIQQAQNDDKLQPVADIAKTMRITTQGQNIIFRAEVSQANLDRLLEFIPKR